MAQKNPKKAAALNIGSALAGGITGAMGAGALQNAFSQPQQSQQQGQQAQQQGQQPAGQPQQQATSDMDAMNTGGRHSVTSDDAGQFLTRSGSTIPSRSGVLDDNF